MNKRMAIEKVAHLTPLQEGMLFHAVMEPESQAYMEQVTLVLEGELHLETLQRSFQYLVDRHEVLRANIYYQSGSRSRLIVFQERKVQIDHVDLTDLTGSASQQAIDAYLETDRRKSYDLSKDPLVRLGVLQKSRNTYVLLLSFHHILMDGWCLGIIMNDLLAAYEAFRQNKACHLPEPQSYTGYARWLEKQDQDAARNYWSSVLAGYEQRATLPSFSGQSQKGNEYRLREIRAGLTKETTTQLRNLARQNAATLSSLFMAAWGIVLGRYNQSEDVVFGTVVSGRPPELLGVEQMVGLFINTIPMRIRFTEKLTFAQVLCEVQQSMIQAKPHDYYSLAEIQAQSLLKQQLLDHIVVFENYPLDDFINRADLEQRLGFVVRDAHLSEEIPYDFNIEVEDAEALSFMFAYNQSVYQDKIMESLAEQLKYVLLQIASTSDIRLSDLCLLTKEQESEVIHDWSGPVEEFQSITFHELFEQQVRQTPEDEAVIYEGTTLTYWQLNDQADRLASVLQQAHGVKAGELVGIMLERSELLLVAVLGIMKAGAAYVPIDPAYPRERIAYMLQDCGTKIVLTEETLREPLTTAGFYGTILDLRQLLLNIQMKEPVHYRHNYDPQSLAYVIYTSGTTGQAKGVMIEHEQYVNTAFGFKYAHGLKDIPVRLLQVASISFDVFAGDMAKAFLNGGVIVICPQRARHDPATLATLMENHRITVMEVPPALLSPLMEFVYEQGTDVSSMRLLITGADILGADNYRLLLKRFGGAMRIINTYGVTEAAIDSTYYEGNADTGAPSGIVSIGKALPNHRLYIVDQAFRPVPVGVAGELCLGGASVAQGYWNKPELTAEKFMTNPFIRGERLYRTGDLARWLPDGNVDFIGRTDNQVKIRGYRIEPGEIESVLLDIEEVRQAAVLAKEDRTGQKYLCAYVAGTDRKEMLREELARKLPSYMVPAQFVMMDSLPLTPNGKIDRKTLPAQKDFQLGDMDYLAPETELEQILVSIWEEVIGVQPIGVKHNFFELGGDSIKALQMSVRLHAKGLRVDIRDLFRYPEIRLVLPYIQTVKKGSTQGIVEGKIDVSPAMLEALSLTSTDADVPGAISSVILRSPDGWEESWLLQALDVLVRHHDALRLIVTDSEDGLTAFNRGVAEENYYDYQMQDWSGAAESPNELKQRLYKYITRPMKLSDGPLLALTQFKLPQGSYLHISLHRVLAEEGSWSLLLQDIRQAYEQAAQGKEVKLPSKTGSYLESASPTHYAARKSAAEKESSYWSAEAAMSLDALRLDREPDQAENSQRIQLEFSLSQQVTSDFLTGSSQAYHTEPMDLLLVALGLSIREWNGCTHTPVLLEADGRANLKGQLDLSRTIGRFASGYPVVLDMSVQADLGHHIKLVKDKLRRVPAGGAGYAFGHVSIPTPQIRFKYYSWTEEEQQMLSPWELLRDRGEIMMQLDPPNAHCCFNVYTWVANEQLHVLLNFDVQKCESSSASEWLGLYQQYLTEIIGHCCAKDTKEHSPTDFTYNQLSINQLEQVTNSLSAKLLSRLK
ncbi:Plipastatin synthase subunit A [compost metagenome]